MEREHFEIDLTDIFDWYHRLGSWLMLCSARMTRRRTVTLTFSGEPFFRKKNEKCRTALNFPLLQLHSGKSDCLFKSPGKMYCSNAETNCLRILSAVISISSPSLRAFTAIIQDKLVWIFNAFDKDGGGTIDYAEIRLKRENQSYV